MMCQCFAPVTTVSSRIIMCAINSAGFNPFSFLQWLKKKKKKKRRRNCFSSQAAQETNREHKLRLQHGTL